MNDANIKRKYILDTNILINLKVFLPPSRFKLFYKKLFIATVNIKVVLLDCVYEELKKGNNKELNSFLADCQNANLVESTVHLIAYSVEVNDKYKMIDEISKKSQADPIIIAYCNQDSINNVLLTREGYKKPSDELYKIPDVCTKMNIKCERSMNNFYEHIDYKEVG